MAALAAKKSCAKAISGKEYTQLAGLFAHCLRYKKDYIACYTHLFSLRQFLLHCSSASRIIHMDVVNADIAGANICPYSL
jgi:hypothetical protein